MCMVVGFLSSDAQQSGGEIEYDGYFVLAQEVARVRDAVMEETTRRQAAAAGGQQRQTTSDSAF
eukprot:COSAG02_NODE_3558_length_6563_cov_38.861850_1_plen_64_part_00